MAILLTLLKRYLKQKLTNKSDLFHAKLLVFPLSLLFFLYWINPISRTAHFNRMGTIQSPTMLVLLPALILTFSFFLIFLTTIRGFASHKFAFVSRKSGSFLPVISFLIFAAVPYFSAYFGLSQMSDFYYLVMRVSNIEPTFADLRTILYGISCPDVNALGDEITCDPRESKTIWNYPTILLSLRNLGVGIDLLLLLAITFTVVIALTIFLISRSLNASGRTWLSVLVFSPPVLLCFDRMNFDLIIVSLVVLAAKLISPPHVTLARFFVALSLLSCASILKFYAFPLLIIITFKVTSNHKYFFLGIAMSSLTFFFMVRDLISVREYVGRDIRGSVGLNVLISLMNGRDLASLEFLSLGFVICLLVILYLFIVFFLHSQHLSDLSFITTTCFLLAILFLIPWLTTSSYYYRLVVIVFLIPLLVAKQRHVFEKAVFVIAAVALYLSPSSLAFIQNILILPIVCFLIICSYKFLDDVKSFLIRGRHG